MDSVKHDKDPDWVLPSPTNSAESLQHGSDTKKNITTPPTPPTPPITSSPLDQSSDEQSAGVPNEHAITLQPLRNRIYAGAATAMIVLVVYFLFYLVLDAPLYEDERTVMGVSRLFACCWACAAFWIGVGEAHQRPQTLASFKFRQGDTFEAIFSEDGLLAGIEFRKVEGGDQVAVNSDGTRQTTVKRPCSFVEAVTRTSMMWAYGFVGILTAVILVKVALALVDMNSFDFWLCEGELKS